MAYITINIFVFVLLFRSMRCTNETITVPTTTIAPENQTQTSQPQVRLFNDTEDLITLVKALRGKCGSEYEIIDILLERNNSQRQQLIQLSTTLYNKDLAKMIRHRFIGDTLRAVDALITPSEQFYAKVMHDAIDGLGTDEKTISEILSTMNNSEIVELSSMYEKVYGTKLRDDLIADTSGFYQMLIVALCDHKRNESNTIDYEFVKTDAMKLKKASKGIINDEQCLVFIEIFTNRSLKHLRATFEEFEKLSINSMIWTLLNRLQGNLDLQYGLLSIVKNVIQSRIDYLAVQLGESISTPWTDDLKLTRIVVGRSEIDLKDIKKSFKHIYGYELAERITFETGGAYKHLLLTLVNRV